MSGRTAGPAYVVRDRRRLLRLAGTWLLTVALVVGAARVTHDGGPVTVGLVLAVATVVLVSRSLPAAGTLLRADAAGLLVVVPDRSSASGGDPRFLPWARIAGIRVDGDLVEVSLRPDAPLPGWVPSRVVDPADPRPQTVLSTTVPGVDPQRLQEIAESCAREVWVSTGVGKTPPG